MVALSNRHALHRKRILVTRARDQSSRLQAALEAEGADVVAIPTIQIIPPDSYEALDAALRDLAAYDWLVLTSVNAVHAVATRLETLAISVEALDAVKIAVIGNATAGAVTGLGRIVNLISPVAVAESLAEAILPLVQGKNERVLIARAKIARSILPDTLRAAGVPTTLVEAYQTIIPTQAIEALREAFDRGLDAVTFTSASSVQNFAALAEQTGKEVLPTTKKISIGPITTRAITEQGWHADAEATNASVDDLVVAVVKAFSAS